MTFVIKEFELNPTHVRNNTALPLSFRQPTVSLMRRINLGDGKLLRLLADENLPLMVLFILPLP
jgi:hypothetical protein